METKVTVICSRCGHQNQLNLKIEDVGYAQVQGTCSEHGMFSRSDGKITCPQCDISMTRAGGFSGWRMG